MLVRSVVQTGQSELAFKEVKLKEYVKNEFIGLKQSISINMLYI